MTGVPSPDEAGWDSLLEQLRDETALMLQLAQDPERVAEPLLLEQWVVPAGLGPLPRSRRSRAQHLLAAQEAARDALMARLEEHRRRRAYAGATGARPVYLDIDA